MTTNQTLGIDYSRTTPGTVVKGLACGCTVDGWGILPDPWMPILCPLHKTALEMLEACETALDNLAPVYASDHLVIKKLRAAITKAKGETS